MHEECIHVFHLKLQKSICFLFAYHNRSIYKQYGMYTIIIKKKDKREKNDGGERVRKRER